MIEQLKEEIEYQQVESDRIRVRFKLVILLYYLIGK